MQKYQFTTYWKNEKTADVVVSEDRQHVIYKRYTDEVPKAPFLFDNPTIEQIYRFLEGRCMPRRPGQLEDYLAYLGLDEYNPWEIVRITHGVMWEDFMWLRFPGEDISWEDVKIRD